MQTETTKRYRPNAWHELSQVLRAWLRGEGELFGLLKAWYEVVSGQVAVD